MAAGVMQRGFRGGYDSGPGLQNSAGGENEDTGDGRGRGRRFYAPGQGERQRLPQQQYYNLQHLKQQQQLQQQGIVYDGKRLRKAFHRKAIDYNSMIMTHLEDRIWQRNFLDRKALQPDILYWNQVPPPFGMMDNPMNCVTTRFVRAATNKIRCPIFCLTWTPDGRRVVTGAATGEFTLWQGLTFSFETILQAHDSSILSMVWSNNDGWLLSGDRNGFVKYWQSNMNNVKMFQAHKDQLLGLSFSPTDQKFASSAADNLVKIWDFWTGTEEVLLRGHGAEVKCVAWHPTKCLLVSGSKDSQQPMKLWDPKAGNCLGTFFSHKGGVNDLKWSPNGLYLLSASRDHTIKLFDVRSMKEPVRTYRGHKRDATALAWHPIHNELFVSGGYDGQLIYWSTSQEKDLHSVDRAHESVIYSISWHPLGHILTTCSNDFSTRFWIRNRPGDKPRERVCWPLSNVPPPPLYGRGANAPMTFGTAGGDEDEDESSQVAGAIDATPLQLGITGPGERSDRLDRERSAAAVAEVRVGITGPVPPGLPSMSMPPPPVGHPPPTVVGFPGFSAPSMTDPGRRGSTSDHSDAIPGLGLDDLKALSALPPDKRVNLALAKGRLASLRRDYTNLGMGKIAQQQRDEPSSSWDTGSRPSRLPCDYEVLDQYRNQPASSFDLFKAAWEGTLEQQQPPPLPPPQQVAAPSYQPAEYEPAAASNRNTFDYRPAENHPVYDPAAQYGYGEPSQYGYGNQQDPQMQQQQQMHQQQQQQPFRGPNNGRRSPEQPPSWPTKRHRTMDDY